MSDAEDDVESQPLQAHLRDYRAWLRAADRPKTTIDLRIYHVTRLARDHARIHSLTTPELIAWLAAHDWSTETRRSYRASLTGYFRWAHATGRIHQDPAAALPPIRPRPGVPRPAGEDRIVDAMLAAEPRVRLMILLGAQAGLRRGEIAQVHSRDVVRDLEGWSLRVHGKGRRNRQVPLVDDLARALLELPPGWAFPSPVLAGQHLTAAHVGKLISAALGPGLTSHQLRHRFATRAYAVDHDLLTVQQLLGHAKPETTMIYTRIPDAAKRRTVVALSAA
ncbi:tyrosine-type recombinase/integrase [Serinicoccus sediminis]|uniref:tyrosine-type recombinase/integrase n=1 Tax=Serinicoccus sediminis TaxID=2306021 RepID=UPI0010221AE5|nr:site-specific integrase [Serinicoccus sediminis]